jgi:protein MpaA
MLIGVAGAALAVGALLVLAPIDHGGRRRLPERSTVAARRPARKAVAHLISHVRLGRSVRRRAIDAIVLGDVRSQRRVLVVGCIHGDERAGIAVAKRLAASSAVPGAALWIVPDLNPDGAAARTRQDANGVDLNRNFPYRWRPIGARGDQQYSGPRPLSEPESRAAYRLIQRVRPAVTIWFHQPLGVVDESGGDVGVERRFSRLTGLPLRRLKRYPGSVATWQDHRFRRATAFVVELPAGRPSRARVERWSRAVRAVAASTAARAAPRRDPASRGASASRVAG